MADVIREAVIKLRLETSGDKISVPGVADATKLIEGYQKALEESNAVQREAAKQSQAITEAAKAEAKAREEAAKAEAKAREEAAKAEAKAREEAAAAEKRWSDAFADASNVARKAQDDLATATKETAAQTKIHTDALLGAGNELKKVGDGAFTLIRGFTLLGVSADSDLGKVVAQVAKAQAAFDIFKGSVDVIDGGVKAFRQMSIAATAAGGASAIAAGAIQSVTAATRALAVMLGPAGLVIAAVAAAIAVISGMYAALNGRSETYREKAERDFQKVIKLAGDARAAVDPEGARAEAKSEAARRKLDIKLASGQGDEGATIQEARDELNATARSQATRLAKRAEGFLDPKRLDLLEAQASISGDSSGYRDSLRQGKELQRDLLRVSQTAAEEDFSLALRQNNVGQSGAQQQRGEAEQLIAERERLKAELASFKLQSKGSTSKDADIERVTARLDEIKQANPEAALEAANEALLAIEERALALVEAQQKRAAALDTAVSRLEAEIESLRSAPTE